MIHNYSKLDSQFIETIQEIDHIFQTHNFDRHSQIRIQQWSKKFCQVTSNQVWKNNRNHYAQALLQQMKKGSIDQPFKKLPPEGPLLNLPVQPGNTRPPKRQTIDQKQNIMYWKYLEFNKSSKNSPKQSEFINNIEELRSSMNSATKTDDKQPQYNQVPQLEQELLTAYDKISDLCQDKQYLTEQLKISNNQLNQLSDKLNILKSYILEKQDQIPYFNQLLDLLD